MSLPFERLGIWLGTLGNTAAHPEHVNRLRVVFTIFRERTAKLLSKIDHALPNLTVHDITHVDALWETADLITGGHRYPLNPMEGFVLGGAILLHDSALCFEAYNGGLDGIRSSIEWQDAFAAEKDRNSERETPLSIKSMESAADFTALRLLHAKRAAELADQAWADPDTGEPIFLIDDIELRKRYGRIIGEIASSHHWSIERVGSGLSNQINAPGDWPAEWRIDPVKIACILRCADAAHIDTRRAPDFLYALTRREGISLQHWKAQNWLARADLDQSDPKRETLLFTSNREFEAKDADAWWIAYDAICLANKEITSVNGLLDSRPHKSVSPSFAIKQVAGVLSPELMSMHVRTRGWKPWHAELHVGNVQRLVKNLGGQSLYGPDKKQQIGIVIRELIQNARDAIVARKEIDPDFEGAVRVNISDIDDELPVLEVIDNGIGMSQRVMTGPLLEMLESRSLSIPELFALTYNLCDFEVDPTSFALTIFFKGPQSLLFTIDQVIDVMRSEPIAIFKWQRVEHMEMHMQTYSYEQFWTFRPARTGSFLSLEMQGELPKNPNSFIGCLYRRAAQRGFTIISELRKDAARSMFEPVDVLILSLKPHQN